eukprot:TRINITY_DN8267_c0_g1_i1.p1 TRINITY_DN8267_c0_g1~~TRINITY_DN8267_c0_g1_i1.p1  ORF type:complete len:130 (+),score=30.15 TRINITY_DN8267_c0_g1_i1:92-481(+)
MPNDPDFVESVRADPRVQILPATSRPATSSTSSSLSNESASRPTTSASRPTTSASRPTTSASRPTTSASRPTTSSGRSSTQLPAGVGVRAIRAIQQHHASPQSPTVDDHQTLSDKIDILQIQDQQDSAG